MPLGFVTVGRWIAAVAASAALVMTAQILATPAAPTERPVPLPDLRGHRWADCATGSPSPSSLGQRRTLILYDRDSAAESLVSARAHATHMANLASHFGPVRVATADDYQAGDMLRSDAVVYVGSRYGAPLTPALLEDVRSGRRPVLWLKNNIYQLASPDEFRRRFGWVWKDFQAPGGAKIHYKGAQFKRPADGAAATSLAYLDRRSVRIVATASGSDGSTIPWAVRSRHLTYVGDLPFDGESFPDGSAVLADLLQNLHQRDRKPAKHRALVRIEDVGPMADPEGLRDIARTLRAKHIPYSVAVYPVYVGPVGKREQTVVRLSQRPEVVRAIVEMLDGGATLILHGYTHQHGSVKNPLTGESGADFEFYRAHLDEDGTVIYDGPVPGDSEQWARDRLRQALREIERAGLPRPRTFNVPHYAASATDYSVIARMFEARYDRGQIFSALWDGSPPASPHMTEQAAPYLVRDSYGSLVVPENLGYVSAEPGATDRSMEDILAGAESLLAVQDGVASFFYHPFLGTGRLSRIVDHLQGLGYTFISPCDL